MGILGKRTLSGLSELGAELSASSASFDGSDGLRTGWEFYEEAAHRTYHEQTQTEVDNLGGLGESEEIHSLVLPTEPAADELSSVWPASPPYEGYASSDAATVAAEAAVSVAAPPAAAPPRTLGEWASGVVQHVARVTPDDEAAWSAYVEHTYGGVLGCSGARRQPVRKLALIDRLLHELRREGVVVLEEALDVEEAESGVQDMIRPGRAWNVPPGRCLEFNTAFRALQATHLDWPRNRAAITETKGITQPLSALGMGPPENVGPWTGRQAGLRGPAETDPEKQWDEGRQRFVASKRDGLYFTRYEFSWARARKNAKHVFDCVPPAP
jgi:hypothetical protein